MGKTADKVRQAKHRENLKGDADAYQAHLEKDKLRKRRKRMSDKMKPIAEQEAHKAAERVRIRNYRINKKKAEQAAVPQTYHTESPYQSKQSTGKALKRVAKSLPCSPRKRRFVLAKMAQEMGLQVKGMHNKSYGGMTAESIDTVKAFYEKNEISWQAPGRKDRIVTREVLTNGEMSKKTVQVRYMLMSLKEAYHCFREEFKDISIGLSKFSEIRPAHIKLFNQIPHNVCVCEYHENIRLILSVLECHTDLSSKFDELVKQVTCNDSCKDCIYRRCDECRDYLEAFKPSPDEGEILTKYQQWQTLDKKPEKVTITATIHDIFDALRAQLNDFLVHRFIKRNQAAHFAQLIAGCDGCSVVLQVDFSENATLLQQDEIQSAHWTHKQVTIFTAHTWIDKHVKESFAIVSDNLNHTKEAVYTFMSFLFSKLTEKYKSIKVINVFSDGAASQLKQRYLFSNCHEWENEFSMKLIWNFFATSHGKGAVDGIGGTVKRSVWRVVRAGTTAPLDAASYAEIASDRNPNVNVKYISSAEIKKDSVKKAPIWSAAVGVPNTLKLHCVRAHNAKMLRVSTVSTKDDFTLVEIFQGAGSDESEPEEQNQPNDRNEVTLEVNIGDWVLVNYDGADFPGEITNIVGFDYEVNVMHKYGAFWKWPLTEDRIFYDRKNVVKKLEPPEVAGTRGQFTFTQL